MGMFGQKSFSMQLFVFVQCRSTWRLNIQPFIHTLACSRPYLPALLWGYGKRQDRPEDALLEIKSTRDLKLNWSWFFLKGMKWNWGPLRKSCEPKLKAVLEWSWNLFLTVTKIMRNESKIEEGSEQFPSLLLEPWTFRAERQEKWWGERTDAVRKSVPQGTLPAYVTNIDYWGEAHQKLLNRY